MRNNLLQKVLARYDHLARMVDVHQHLLLELQEVGVVGDQLLTLAELSADRDLLHQTIQKAKSMMTESEPILQQVFEQGLERKQKELDTVEHMLSELRESLRKR